MLEPFGRVHALDIAHESMKHCYDRGFERVVTASGHELPFGDASFDFVGLFDTIEHIPDDASVLREVARILKPTGLVFLSVPAYQFLYSQNDRLVHHCRRYTRSQMNTLLEESGFTPVKASYFNAFLFPAHRARRAHGEAQGAPDRAAREPDQPQPRVPRDRAPRVRVVHGLRTVPAAEHVVSVRALADRDGAPHAAHGLTLIAI